MAVKKPLPESVIEAQIFAYLRSKGILCFKTIQSGYFDTARGTFRRQQSPFFIRGVSDCLGLLPNGRFLAIEVKSKYGKVSLFQERFIESVSKSGGIAFVARSLEEVKEKLCGVI